MGIRNSVKAIIVRDNKILLNKSQNTLGNMFFGLPDGAVYYDLPGGGQNQYESLEEAVVRECREETGHTVAPVRLAGIYEEIVMDGWFREEYEPYAHKLYFLLICRLTDAPVNPPTEKDIDMLCSEWVDMGELGDILLFPAAVKASLKALVETETVINLGSDRIW